MEDLLNNLIPNVMNKLPTFYTAIQDTLIMVLWSGSISFFLGLFLGIALIVTKPDGILENRLFYQVLDKIINFFRSIPFIILLTWVILFPDSSWEQQFMCRGQLSLLSWVLFPSFQDKSKALLQRRITA
jgi:D-methionine transport system permease protein